MTQRFDCGVPAERTQGLTAAAAAIRRGSLVVVPTDSAYAVACDAFNPKATAKLRAAKGRSDNTALPVMVSDPQVLDALLYRMPAAGKELISAFWPGPLTIVARQQPSLVWDVDPSGRVAVRMPLHPLALDLLGATGPLAVTGANYSGLPVPLTCSDAQEQLGSAVDIYLDAGPMSLQRASAIIDVTANPPKVMRTGSVPAEQLQQVWGDLVLPDSES